LGLLERNGSNCVSMTRSILVISHFLWTGNNWMQYTHHCVKMHNPWGYRSCETLENYFYAWNYGTATPGCRKFYKYRCDMYLYYNSRNVRLAVAQQC
jgi:hypothetical protein